MIHWFTIVCVIYLFISNHMSINKYDMEVVKETKDLLDTIKDIPEKEFADHFDEINNRIKELVPRIKDMWAKNALAMLRAFEDYTWWSSFANLLLYHLCSHLFSLVEGWKDVLVDLKSDDDTESTDTQYWFRDRITKA